MLVLDFSFGTSQFSLDLEKVNTILSAFSPDASGERVVGMKEPKGFVSHAGKVFPVYDLKNLMRRGVCNIAYGSCHVLFDFNGERANFALTLENAFGVREVDDASTLGKSLISMDKILELIKE